MGFCSIRGGKKVLELVEELWYNQPVIGMICCV